jgi:hypothetical protein
VINPNEDTPTIEGLSEFAEALLGTLALGVGPSHDQGVAFDLEIGGHFPTFVVRLERLRCGA